MALDGDYDDVDVDDYEDDYCDDYYEDEEVEGNDVDRVRSR